MKNNRIRLDYKDLVRLLKSLGYEESRKGRTKHTIYKHRVTNQTIPVSVDSGTIPAGILNAILREVGVTRDDVLEFMYGKKSKNI